MSGKSRETVTVLVAPSFPRWLFWVAFEWTLVAGVFWALRRFPHPVTYLVGLLLIGSRQHALGVLAHEGIHRSAARSRWLNDWAARWLTAWPVGLSFDGFRKFHLAHHAHLATPGDPEIVHKGLCAPEWDLPVTRSRLAFLFAKDLCGLSLRSVITLSSLAKPSRLDRCGLTACGALAVMAGVLTGSLWMVGLWLIALPTSFWAFFRLRALAEHSGGRHAHRVAYPKLWHALLLPHQIGYHYEHHRWPTIPFWNLPRARKLDQNVPIVTISTLFSRFAEAEPFAYRPVGEKKTRALPGIAGSPITGGA